MDAIFMNLIETQHPWFLRHTNYNKYRQAAARYKAQFSNLLPLCFDDISQDPDYLLKQISNFLELDYSSHVGTDFFQTKINTLPVSYEPGQKVVTHLTKLLAPLTDDLAKFLDRDLIR